MCVVSNVGDGWSQTFPDRYPYLAPQITPGTIQIHPDITREEFDELKNEMSELKKLLIAAKKFDEATGQPECEMDEKVALIKKVAELVGVDMNEVFGQR